MKPNENNMQLHKVYNYINNYLPKVYAEIAYQRLGKKYSKHTIRKVKNDVNYINKEILSCLVEISKENKKEIEQLLTL